MLEHFADCGAEGKHTNLTHLVQCNYAVVAQIAFVSAVDLLACKLTILYFAACHCVASVATTATTNTAMLLPLGSASF